MLDNISNLNRDCQWKLSLYIPRNFHAFAKLSMESQYQLRIEHGDIYFEGFPLHSNRITVIFTNISNEITTFSAKCLKNIFTQIDFYSQNRLRLKPAFIGLAAGSSFFSLYLRPSWTCFSLYVKMRNIMRSRALRLSTPSSALSDATDLSGY